MTGISLDELAQAAADLVVSRLQETYDLVCVERGDGLTGEQIQNFLAGERDVLDEEWESEGRWSGMNAVLDNLLERDARDFLDEHDALEKVGDALQERDQSDPLSDLMRQTGPQLFRYRLDAEVEGDPCSFSDEQLTTTAHALAQAAGIDFWDNAVALRELAASACPAGGGVYVLWRGEVKPLYEAVCTVRWRDPAPAVTVTWSDPELLVLDQWNGSGHTVRVRGPVRLAFDADRLSLDAARSPHGCSWTDVTGGYRPQGDGPDFTEAPHE